MVWGPVRCLGSSVNIGNDTRGAGALLVLVLALVLVLVQVQVLSDLTSMDGRPCVATILRQLSHAPLERSDRRSPMSDISAAPQFPITTALEFPEWTVERNLGLTFGLVVRSMGAAKGFTAGFRALAGGEVKQYTKLLEDTRRHALDRMIENARVMGANAVISFRFDSSEIGQSLTEIVAYGTAVVVGTKQ